MELELTAYSLQPKQPESLRTLRTAVHNQRKLLLTAGLLTVAAVTALAAGSRYAADIRFAPQPAALRDMPLVMTGADLYRLTGAARPAVASLRVRLNGEERACQVDERNASGQYAKSNGVLDDDDEIVFYLDFESNQPATLTISWSTDAPPPDTTGNGPAAEPNLVSLTPDTKTSYVELWAETETFRIGFNAHGLDDPTLHKIGNYGRAACAVLEFRGKRLTDITSAWANVIPAHPFGYGEGPHHWTPLATAKRGPVRTLLTTRRTDYEQGVRAEFAIYGRGPAIDLRYAMQYTRQEPEEKGTQQLAFRYPMRLGDRADTGDVMLVPLAGRIHEYRLTEEDLQAFYPTRYETPLPDEGWFAWVDTAEEVGLAVFFEKMPAIRDRAEWVDSRPTVNPHVRIRTIPGGRPENTVTWHRRSIHTARHWSCQNRLVGLRSADPNWLHFAYRLWGEPLERLADVSLPRRVETE